MISIILPYWDRQAAADKALGLLAKHYSHLDMEVIIVDDGNEIPFKIPDLPIKIRVLNLPQKDVPLSPCTCWNEGVKFAEGEIIVISCIEMLHETPILEQMKARLTDPKSYVLASAWCPEENKWHCHSTVIVPTCPSGTGQTYCAMLYKDFYQGFDEIYREGAGYEDRDFIWRMYDAGAKFDICDDLSVVHPKTNAKIVWANDAMQRNCDIYYSTRGVKKVTFLCLKAGDAYPPEYVNNLFRMVKQNLSAGYPGRFVCLTDNPEGLDKGIETLPLPSDLETWWGKLYMFKRGLFPDGERLIFMDLDTLIVGNIDDIARYKGRFATLRDFYHPSRVGPAIIAWEAGEFASSIWGEWVAEGKPRHPMGDLWWLNNLDQGKFAREIDILQDLYPKQFVSYKVSCNPHPPQGARVVCFHGQPKPDNCGQEWVENIWRKGQSFAELESIANTNLEVVKSNTLSACKRDIKRLDFAPEHDKVAVLVGGGPSLKDTLEEVKQLKEFGATIISLNGSALFLNENGIIPDIQVVIDARRENLRFLDAESKEVFLASQCHPDLFDKASNVTLFHLNTEGAVDYVPDESAHLISSGTTVGLSAMAIAYVLGYRVLHLHGYDSSYEDSHHAYSQPENDQDRAVEAVVDNQTFKAAPWMIKQAQQFQELSSQLAEAGVTIVVAGKGLLPTVARCMANFG